MPPSTGQTAAQQPRLCWKSTHRCYAGSLPPQKVQSQVPCPNTDATISADCQHSLCYELHPASRRVLGVVQLKTSVYFQRGFLVFVPLTSVETLYFTCEERCGKCLNWQKR